MKNHYFTTKMAKMGLWALRPADNDTWRTEETAMYHKKIFGFPKGILDIMTLDDGMQHPYVPVSYLKQLSDYITESAKKGDGALSRRLMTFYPFRKRAVAALARLVARDYRRLTSAQLIKLYRHNRSWVHRAATYDQFGWLAEDCWMPLMKKILTQRLKLKAGSDEYHRVLFALTKPEEISTTLAEKRAVIHEAIRIKRKKQTITKASKKLARTFGWMPVFAYGDPWKASHYETELRGVLKKSLAELTTEYHTLKNWSVIRNRELRSIQNECAIADNDLQVFIEFGLALDARNEAEYIVSLGGFYLRPLYREIARRLALSLTQVRNLFEFEIVDALRGALDPHEALYAKGQIIGVGYTKSMTKRFVINPEEARRLFKHLESYVKNVHGGDEARGECASPGTATGTVRLVPTPEHNRRVKDGDILIANSTTVDFLPAMKKAAAIVTEVGGLTCHAAVVSREFGIPCVVALTNAMKNFKDGERVEVDADKGIVKKI